MSLSSAVRERCKEFLPVDEQLRYLFLGTAVWVRKGPFVSQFYVAVADSQIVVINRSMFRGRPNGVWARYPRSIRLGPVELHPSLGPTCRIGSLELEVSDDYVAVISAADAEIGDDEILPADPLPDL